MQLLESKDLRRKTAKAELSKCSLAFYSKAMVYTAVVKGAQGLTTHNSNPLLC